MLDEKYRQYAELLVKWNKNINLSGARTVEAVLAEHVQDSLSLVPFLTNVRSVLDVGTGAGLPGIPLAIARPDISFKLLDSTQKKINFLQHVITSLQLSNVEAICARVEALQEPLPVDMIVT